MYATYQIPAKAPVKELLGELNLTADSLGRLLQADFRTDRDARRGRQTRRYLQKKITALELFLRAQTLAPSQRYALNESISKTHRLVALHCQE